jgi:2-iminobutanoate/2-iminopropanoate deaminase
MEMINDPNAATNTGSYSPALRFGPLVMVSGQGPISPEGEIVSGSIEDETRLTMNNIKKLIEAAGARMDQIVKCNFFLEKMSDFDAFDAVYREFFKETFPCRTTVAAGLLDIKVKIDAMAYTG